MALEHLENIDDNADKLSISLVKINDLELVEENGLSSLPSLVYYRNQAPIVYEGEIHLKLEHKLLNKFFAVFTPQIGLNHRPTLKTRKEQQGRLIFLLYFIYHISIKMILFNVSASHSLIRG